PAWPRRDSRWRLPLQRLTTVVVSIRSARFETPNATELVRSNPHLSRKPRRRPPKTAKACNGNRRYLYRHKSHLRAAATMDLCVSTDRSLALRLGGETEPWLDERILPALPGQAGWFRWPHFLTPRLFHC